MLEPLDIKPGIYTEASDRAALLRWKAGSNVRFFQGWAEKVGGWIKLTATQFTGICRAMVSWVSLDDARYVAMGTHKKLYLTDGSAFYDVTPISSSGSLTNAFATTNTDSTVTVTHNAHGRVVGDYVEFLTVANDPVGGLTMVGEWVVATVPTAGTYTFEHTSTATSSVTVSGGAITYEFQIAIGLEDTIVGTGFGAGPFGAGSTDRTIGFVNAARTWSLSNWGEDLIACPRGGKIYTWVENNGTGTRAVAISQAPAQNLLALVSPEDRQIVSFGAYDSTLGKLDHMLVAWCDSEDYTTWIAASTNNAGTKRLDRGNEIVTAQVTRSEIIIITDKSVYAMRRSGDDFVFDFKVEGETIGAMSPNSAVDVDGVVYYMGRGEFMKYDGEVTILNTEVHSHVFGNINKLQAAKVFGARNKTKDEIIWFYTSASATENDKCVGYNYLDDVWWVGTIARTTWLDENVLIEEPLASCGDSYLWVHESGNDDNAGALAYSLESYDFELPGRLADGYGSGEFVRRLSSIYPDVKRITGSHLITITGKKYPQGESFTKGPLTLTSADDHIDTHMRARQISIKIEGTAIGTDIALGQFRVKINNAGRR